MLTYTTNTDSHIPKYEYLYQCIKQDILQGKLQAGEQLPSKRAFAENQNVSVATVENAYAQLLAEGYIFSKPRSGFFVENVSNLIPKKEKKYILSSQPSIKKQDEFFVDLVSNRITSHQFPFSIWAKLMREVISKQKEQLMLPSESQGVFALRQAISYHLHAFRNLDVHPDQIIIGAGAEYLYGLFIQLLGHQQNYAIENPGYPKLRMIYQAHGIHCTPITLDQKGLCPKSLEKSNAQIVHLSPSHHFPTGIVMPIGRRYELFEWALKKNDRFIIEDDYDSEFRLSGNPIPTMISLDENGKVIYMNTFTKSLTPTIRISYMVLPPALLQKFRKQLGFYSCTVSNFEQYTLARFIQKGYFEKHINRMRKKYRTLRDELIQEIRKSNLHQYGIIQEEEAGLHFLFKVQTSYSDKELIQRAAEHGIRVTCLSQYYENPASESTRTLVINYSGLERNKIGDLIIRFQHCLLPEKTT